MKLDALARDPLAAWLHLERYVNKGSPSGFSEVNRPPGAYDPRGLADSFQIPCVWLGNESVKGIGDWPPELPRDQQRSLAFLLHPAMTATEAVQRQLAGDRDGSVAGIALRVAPTASGRTVWVHDLSAPLHLKLHYPGVLGRVDRALPAIKAVAGWEISRDIVEAIDRGEAPNCLALLPETCARWWSPSLDPGTSIGLIARAASPYPQAVSGTYLIPVFALISRDSRAMDDAPLLAQLLDRATNPESLLIERILQPLVRAYCYLAFERGLLPELNAQNVLLEVSSDHIPLRLVLRDMSRVEKALHIRRGRGLSVSFLSAPYKCIDTTADPGLAMIRHSFSFDFKLGLYCLAELVDTAAAHGLDGARLDASVREYVERIAGPSLREYLPSGRRWYAHEKILLTEQRPYVARDNARFR